MGRSFWKGKRTLVTGSSGFLGRSLVPLLQKQEADLSLPRSSDYDLREEESVKRMMEETKPEVVLHLAVNGGGIGYMKANPGSVYYDNIRMNTNMVHQSYESGVKKFVGIGTVCEYPKFTAVPFREEDLWKGYPEETNAAYGLSKKMMLVQTMSYRQQYGFNGIHLLLANMYGPHDNFDPERSHVIPALIRKFIEAKESGKDSVTVWGTGKASREFLYVGDAAQAIALAAEKYDRPEPVNIGTGRETVIRDLVTVIKNLTGFAGGVKWDAGRPDGQPKRHLDVSLARREFGFSAKTSLEEGLRKTIEWYVSERS